VKKLCIIKYFWIIVILQFNCNTLFAQEKLFPNQQLEGFPYFENFYEKDFNAYASSYSITQAPNQFLYIANGSGILEYDGRDWLPIHYGSLKMVIKANNKGEIFFYDYYNRRFGLLQPSNGKAFKEIVLLYDSTADYINEIKNILINGDKVYFTSGSNIDLWNGAKLKSWKSNSNFGASAILKGDLIVQEVGKGLLILNNDSLLPYFDDSFLKKNTIDYILTCTSGKMLLSVHEKGLFSLENKKLTPFSTLFKEYGKGIELSNGQFLYIAGRDGLHALDAYGNIIQILNEYNGICNDHPSDLCIDHQGNTWVTTMNGISKIEYNQPFRWFNKNNGLHEQVWRVISFKNEFYVFTRNKFYRLIHPQQSIKELSYKNSNIRFEPFLKTACHDALLHNNRLLAIACEGIFELNKSNAKKLKFYAGLPIDFIHRFSVSHYDTNRIFVSTDVGLVSLYNKNELKDEGIIKYIKGIFLGDDKNGDFWVVQNGNIEQVAILNKKVNSIVTKSPSSKIFKLNDEILKSNNKSFFSFSDNIYASTPGKVYIFSTKAGNFQIDQEFEGLLKKNEYISALYLNDKSGNLWVSITDASQRFTSSARVIGLIDNKYKSVDFELNRISGSTINSISQENDSTYWISTNTGLARYTRKTSDLFKDEDLTYIRKVILNNDSTLYNTNSRNKDIFQSFKYRNNNVAFEFVITSYIEKHKNKFQFKLDGADSEWSNWTTNSKVNYAKLWEGTYCFRVRGQNYKGQITTEDYFRFIILPPWYRTWYLYCIYALLLVAIVYLTLKWRVSKIKKANQALELKIIERTQEIHQKNIQLEKKTAELKELDKQKSNFFANISHEFRTPLTLIIGPLHELMKEVKDSKLANKLALINKHAEKLKNQINQLLELSRFEMKEVKPNLGQYSINKVVGQFAASFHTLAKIKEIDFKITLLPDDITFHFDREKIETVLSNLLSNAFKFTPNGGKVSISLASETEQIIKNNDGLIKQHQVIQVKDTGIGINKEQLPFIFSRFYQADSSRTKKYEGTGIGLALVKEIVEMHQGIVEAQSIENTGTTIIVKIPVNTDIKENTAKETITDDNIILPEKNTSINDYSGYKLLIEQAESAKPTTKLLKPTILVVEDNKDMATYITDILNDGYKVIVAENGQLGLKEALKTMPDLVISDLMMPVMDGFQLSVEIRNNILTSHIPLILLTAKADIDTKIEGLQTGADDFIQKPFVKEELLVRVKNLITQRQLLIKKYEKRLSIEPVEVATASMDEQFLNKVALLLEKNYADADYSVEKLSTDIGFSYRNFHRKIKALTGKNPSLLILNYKLDRAAQLIKQKAAPINEIAFLTGFNDPSYFTKCFKKHFGYLPSEFEN
jgi:signal transduction histidine kinase/DNA-binding response OmpR family regulator